MKELLTKYKWHRGKELSCCGYILDGKKQLTGKELEDYLTDRARKNGLVSALQIAEGRFSLCGKIDNTFVAACDSLRTYPLFYHLSGNTVLISDSAYSLLAELEKPALDKNAVNELLQCGFVLNNKTLVKEIKQIRAGEYISFEPGFNSYEYHNFAGYSRDYSSPAESKIKLSGILEEVFAANLSALNNISVVLPLSGGYDSRLIAVMLKKYYSGRVITFTYGSKSNPEFNIAEKVAEKLGFEWIPVVYDEKLTADYLSDNSFESYYKYSSELSSIFFFQDYFAVKYLKENKLIPDDSVFIPGHTGDVLSGGHLLPGHNRTLSANKISSFLTETYFKYIKPGKIALSETRDEISKGLRGDSIPAYREVENWEYKERQAKMIINSASVFSFFGYSWIIPLWDKRLADFFGKLAFEDKLYSRLYRQVLKEDFFSKYDLNFDKELKPSASRYRMQLIKDSIKKCLPSLLVNLFISTNDPYYYRQITAMLMQETRSEYRIPLRQVNYYNALIAQYLAGKTEDLIYSS